ncbi:MAG: hypothetical protein NTZ48_04520 [Candidatus Omnitrophica bacterium]|nr:hypothetical protein [Candidatus Omnitrophota bacterium]
MFLLETIVRKAREEGILLIEVRFTKTITRIFLETFFEESDIIDFKFFPESNPVYATFKIPSTSGVIPGTGEHKIP